MAFFFFSFLLVLFLFFFGLFVCLLTTVIVQLSGSVNLQLWIKKNGLQYLECNYNYIS